jgi:hypothetical protein
MASDYPFWYLQTFLYSLWSDRGSNPRFTVLESITLIRSGVEPTIYSTRVDHADQTGGRTHDLQYSSRSRWSDRGSNPRFTVLESITLIKPGVDPTIYSTRVDHANQTGGRPHDLQYSRRSRWSDRGSNPRFTVLEAIALIITSQRQFNNRYEKSALV